MTDSDQKQLKDYSDELGLSHTMSLDEVIKAHRRLRDQAQINHQEWLTELEKGREVGKQQGLAIVTCEEYIKVDKLKAMTLAELANFLAD